MYLKYKLLIFAGDSRYTVNTSIKYEEDKFEDWMKGIIIVRWIESNLKNIEDYRIVKFKKAVDNVINL